MAYLKSHFSLPSTDCVCKVSTREKLDHSCN